MKDKGGTTRRWRGRHARQQVAIAAAALGSAAGISGTAADVATAVPPCDSPTHCYALKYQGPGSPTDALAQSNMLTMQAYSLPNWNSSDRMQLEQWTGWLDGSWVEAGATVGLIGGRAAPQNVSTPRYFKAHAGAGGSGLIETDMTNGPSLNSSYKVSTDDTASDQCWHYILQSTDLGCTNTGYTVSHDLETGIETTATNYKLQGEGDSYYRGTDNAWHYWVAPTVFHDGAFCATMPGGTSGTFHVGTAAGLC